MLPCLKTNHSHLLGTSVLKHLQIILLATPLLTACGSDSDLKDEFNGIDSDPKTEFSGQGTLLISGQAIAGMSYQTETKSGVTDALGNFEYAQGESVEFTLAGLDFGTVNGKPSVEISDFEAQPLPSSYADFERYRQQSVLLNNGINGIDISLKSYANPQALDRLANRLFLLYSLDNDNQADNGIQLTVSNDTSAIFSQVSLPINLNTTEYTGRMHSRAKALDYNKGLTGFTALHKYLTAQNIVISYPEVMCSGTTNNDSVPTNWSVNYKNAQQQTILSDSFKQCAPVPKASDFVDYAKTYSSDNLLSRTYLYDELNRLTHEYRDTDGSTEVFNRLYQHDYSVDDANSVEAISYYYDNNGTKILHDITSHTYLPSGLLYSTLVDDADNDLRVYAYNNNGTPHLETFYTEFESACYADTFEEVTATNYFYYYDSGLLKQRKNEEICSVNTYDYSYNQFGQTLNRFHNVDAISDTNPETINYEYALFSEFNASGDMTFYSSVSRWYDGSLANSQYDRTYGYDENMRLNRYSNTSINHNVSPVTPSISISTYEYNDNGKIEKVCANEECTSKTTYGYTPTGLISWVARFYNEQLTGKTFYVYNDKNLVDHADTFDSNSLDEALDPITPAAPDYQTRIEYLPSGAISVINSDGQKEYFKNPELDNSQDENGYYQWFSEKLGEHLNKEMAKPRTFEAGGET